jgi:hypothetical protein
MSSEEDHHSETDDTLLPILPPPTYRLSSLDEPLANMPELDESQRKALDALRAVADEIVVSLGWTDNPVKRAWLDEACLRRFLRARSWVVDDSATLLRECCAWRDEKKIWTLHGDRNATLKNEIATGKMYRNGFDRLKRPIIYSRDRRQNSRDYPAQVESVINCLERAAATMDRSAGVEQWVFMFDFAGYSMANAPPFHVSREVLDVFQSRFPERLGLAVMIDVPWLWSFTFKAISPFLSPSTKAKIRFVSGDLATKREALSDVIDPAVLEHYFGGDSKKRYYPGAYWREETAQVALENVVTVEDDDDDEPEIASNSSSKLKKKKKKKQHQK